MVVTVLIAVVVAIAVVIETAVVERVTVETGLRAAYIKPV